MIGNHHDIESGSSGLVRLTALADLAANLIYSFPLTEKQQPIRNLLARFQCNDSDAFALHYDELEPDLLAVLRGLEVSDALWQSIEPRAFFEIALAIAPKVVSLTDAFFSQGQTN